MGPTNHVGLGARDQGARTRPKKPLGLMVEDQNLTSMSVDEKLPEEHSMSVDVKLEEQSASLLRLLTFYVQYDKNGDLTVGDRQIRGYSLPESVSEQVTKNPVAFWI
jgi:hypothetical protein